MDTIGTHEQNPDKVTRRQLLSLAGRFAGGAAMYHTAHSLGFAAESTFTGPPRLSEAKRGATVLILGAGLAGMTAAYELRKVGYQVRILEFNERAGGRCWTIRGGDTITDLSGETQRCGFAKGNYFNAGPWRIPYHHHGVMHYCRELGVKLEPFVQNNFNAYLHNTNAFGGKPQRFRHVQTDYQGHIAELLAKATNQGALDDTVTQEDRDKLLESLRSWGALDTRMKYVKGASSSARRGFEVDPGGGLSSAPVHSTPIDRSTLLRSDLWKQISTGQEYEYAPAIFQPSGGMDSIAHAFEKSLWPFIQYAAKVVRIHQSDTKVTIAFVDSRNGGAPREVSADWCVCTIPLTILNQLQELQVSDGMRSAIAAVPYAASYKAAIEFKRRFWEQDESIYGGISYTNLPLRQIAYPSDNFNASGPGVMLAAYTFGVNAFEFTAQPHSQRMQHVLDFGAKIHPQMREEFASGIDVGWHRMPFSQGCYGLWTPETRERYYDTVCSIDGRLVLAGEHASYLPAWQEGAVLSALDAIERLHAKAIA
ncbi:flavin monoamine oxidase family protein [Pandoraea anhela]|uniref:Tryptophan 2-monooxygenase n=1 Tax=Pandoraea anhela TaxID=2508295 RepID=A0A5E4YSZ9_9BURK|nr:flavin monoamine oxidase family protein [Pandoraea anhela]VVE51535.1 monoamine oxidase [Pandoraea anhela]